LNGGKIVEKINKKKKTFAKENKQIDENSFFTNISILARESQQCQ